MDQVQAAIAALASINKLGASLDYFERIDQRISARIAGAEWNLLLAQREANAHCQATGQPNLY